MINVRNAWGILTAIFLLILVYLLVTNVRALADAASKLIAAADPLARTLQGR